MTLPFENDTSRIVKKYAKHSISQSPVSYTHLGKLLLCGWAYPRRCENGRCLADPQNCREAD